MCKLCNLFSPNQSELLSHVSEKHTEEGTNVNDIIIPLQPLTAPTNINRNGEGTFDKLNDVSFSNSRFIFLMKPVAWWAFTVCGMIYIACFCDGRCTLPA